MAFHITHEVSEGTVAMETYVGHDLATITLHSSTEEAFEATFDQAPSSPIKIAVEGVRAARREAVEQELDERYPWRHDSTIKILARGFVYSLTHWGRP